MGRSNSYGGWSINLDDKVSSNSALSVAPLSNIEINTVIRYDNLCQLL